MAKIITKCPHCGIELEAETSWVGRQVNCPNCQNQFIVQPPEEPKEDDPNASPQQGQPSSFAEKILKKIKELFQTGYCWGRIYIWLSRAIAILTVAVAIISCFVILLLPWKTYFQKKGELAEKVPEIVEEQNLFQKEYLRIASLVLTGNNSNARFNFPADITTIKTSFNEDLMTFDEIQESVDCLKEYEQKIELISKTMGTLFINSASRIQRELRKGDAIHLGGGGGGISMSSKSSNIVISSGKNSDFYEKDPGDHIIDLNNDLDTLENLAKSKSLLITGNLKKIKDGVDFISLALNQKQENRIVAGTSAAERKKAPRLPRTFGKELYGLEKSVLQRIIENSLLLCQAKSEFRWTIITKHDKLLSHLNYHCNALKEIRKERSAAIKKSLVHAGLTLLSSLISAFLILVFSDFLLAHFDSADTLKAMLKKMNLFILLPFLMLFFTFGCGRSLSPEEQLKRDLPELSQAFLAGEMQNIIKENSDLILFGEAGKTLIIVQGGTFYHSPVNESFMVGSFGRNYTIAKWEYIIGQVSCNKVNKDKKGTLTSSFNLNYTEKTGAGQECGVLVGAVTPENFSNMGSQEKENWFAQIQKQLPEQDYDYPVAASRISCTRAEPKISPCQVIYDKARKKWQLAEPPELTLIRPLPVVSEAQIEEMLSRKGYRKLMVTKDGEKKPQWFSNRDYVIAENISNGMAKSDGKWKKISVIQQNQKVSLAIQEWKEKNKVNCDDFEKLLLTGANAPDAENRNDLFALAENDFQKVFIDSRQEISQKNLNELQELIERINSKPCYKLIHHQKLINRCNEIIRNIRANQNAQAQKIKNHLRNRIERLEALKKEIKAQEKQSDYEWPAKVQEEAELWQNKSFVGHCNSLYALLKLRDRDVGIYHKLKANKWQIGEHNIWKTCCGCNGSGIMNCQKCSNTGICSICNGSGSYRVTRSSINGKEISHYDEDVSCDRYCRWCNKRTKKCRYCKGQGGKVEFKMLPSAIKYEIAYVISDINTLQNNLRAALQRMNGTAE